MCPYIYLGKAIARGPLWGYHGRLGRHAAPAARPRAPAQGIRRDWAGGACGRAVGGEYDLDQVRGPTRLAGYLLVNMVVDWFHRNPGLILVIREPWYWKTFCTRTEHLRRWIRVGAFKPDQPTPRLLDLLMKGAWMSCNNNKALERNLA